jgi:hypothetical protein
MADRRTLTMRRYLLRLLVAMTGYTITLGMAVALVRDGNLSGPLAWLLALLPGLCVVGVFWAYARLLIEEKDEYLRMLLVRQSLIATAFTLSIATMWGFLATFGQAPAMGTFYIAALWFVGLGIGQAWNGWHGRRASEDA